MLASLPDPVRLVLDNQSTSYDDPFLRSKTTRRAKYDAARERLGALRPHLLPQLCFTVFFSPGATLHPSDNPSDPPFDVVLFNPRGEITETSISNLAFRFSRDPAAPFVTPRASSGLLEGVQRAELLEKGEVVEGVVTVDEVKKAVEVRFTSSFAA